METRAVIDQNGFLEAMRVLMHEAYVGPADQRGTWFVDNEPDCGFIRLLARVNAAQASKVSGFPEGSSIAGHAHHVRFALSLVNRASSGENAFENADWQGSWNLVSVTEEEWKALILSLDQEFKKLVSTLRPGPFWSNPMMLTGSMAVIAHGAWHLGAVRQLIHAIHLDS